MNEKAEHKKIESKKTTSKFAMEKRAIANRFYSTINSQESQNNNQNVKPTVNPESKIDLSHSLNLNNGDQQTSDKKK